MAATVIQIVDGGEEGGLGKDEGREGRREGVSKRPTFGIWEECTARIILKVVISPVLYLTKPVSAHFSLKNMYKSHTAHVCSEARRDTPLTSNP